MSKKTKTTWSAERKRAHSERMNQVWAQRKANLRRRLCVVSKPHGQCTTHFRLNNP